MTVGSITFHVLDVGQGACNFVEIFNEDGDVSHIMLIDLGTNSSQKIATENIAWLREQIENNNNYLDVLVLTHGDTDHYNMIAKILPAFGPPAGDQIGMVRYGGPAWRYKRGALITTLGGYTGDIGSFTPSQSGYAPDDDPVWEPIWQTGDEADDAFLQLIIANTPHPRDPASFAKYQSMNAEAVNTKSVVLGLEWDGHWIVATGDATSTTLGAIDDLLENEDDLPKTFMMTVPHHGSRKTTYDLKNASDIPDNLARGVVDDVLMRFEPYTYSISAGEKRHHHPSMYLVEQFADNIYSDVTYWGDPDLDNGRHFLTSWIDLTVTGLAVAPAWPPGARWQYATTQTRENVYSTLYFKDVQYNLNDYDRYIAPPLPAAPSGDDKIDDVPAGRNWEFRMDDEALHVGSSENEARAKAERADVARSVFAGPRAAFTTAGRTLRMAGTASSVIRLPRPIARLAAPHAVPAVTTATGRLRGLKVIA
ncbi:hypothetical protein [Breoghania sp. JC706]|uniref:hypothetical protein n=1 Tax=Breoghania sp. JC706 TaxID=3117732 RepID=UPI0030083CED